MEAWTVVVFSGALVLPAAACHIRAEPTEAEIPVGEDGRPQSLVLVTKRDGQLTRRSLTPVRFAPMVHRPGTH